ncbi:hypothetical protein [Verrucosispora sp. WMMD573]|uniref:hypothetical protein n=1 Tax=Verrucosispora sp. WMMD573 TaxID=3015149 RepID=UPI00248CC480|nr:hypothetical protein [Verrucosispora sp. WMMD573]WBB53886.1 hypothetical protein O7601_25540 [Verrucosispora sp. WMMD573]
MIAVALDARQTNVTAPVQVDVAYSPGTGKADTTSLSLVLQHEFDAVPEAAPPTAVIVLFCGELATGIDMVNRFDQPVKWKPVQPKSENGDYWSMLGGSMSRCVYTHVSLDSGGVGLRQEILSGVSRITCTRASGPRLLYVLPGLTTLPPASAGDIAFRPLPPKSRATIGLYNQPDDFNAQTASPQLPDAGILRWTRELPGGAGPLSYRLRGELLDTAALQQRDLFMAGALAGVAGGGIMLVLEATVQLLLNHSRKRAANPQAMAPPSQSQDRTEAPVPIAPPAAAPPRRCRDRSVSIAVTAAVGTTAALILLRRRRNRRLRARP